MNDKIRKLFGEATFEPDRLVNGWYHPYIPLQVYGEPARLSITEEQYKKFAELIIKECIDKIETYRIPCGNSPAGEMACEWTYDALKSIRDDIKETFGIE